MLLLSLLLLSLLQLLSLLLMLSLELLDLLLPLKHQLLLIKKLNLLRLLLLLLLFMLLPPRSGRYTGMFDFLKPSQEFEFLFFQCGYVTCIIHLIGFGKPRQLPVDYVRYRRGIGVVDALVLLQLLLVEKALTVPLHHDYLLLLLLLLLSGKVCCCRRCYVLLLMMLMLMVLSLLLLLVVLCRSNRQICICI